MVAAKAAATEELVASIPFNSNKPGEFGADNAVSPPMGFSVEAPSPSVGSSTVSESNGSDKTGTGDAPEGVDPLTGSLDRVRVDNTGRTLTTNQGVAVGDNQNS
ncbi:MAG: catalase HPII, partial [Gemmatimonadaceae bacterium]|nr:catalase HPII [Gemmatimonadaceae bacterium]